MKELIEKIAAEAGITTEQAEKAAASVSTYLKTKTPHVFHDQLDVMMNGGTMSDAMKKKMGDLKNLVSMMPGMGKALKDVDINDGAFKKVESIIQSMTPVERANPELLNMNRKTRIAKGCGQTVHEVTAFIKQFDQMKQMMQQMTSGKGMGNMMKQMQNMRGMN